jgi:golgi SNAP receptor complex member 2
MDDLLSAGSNILESMRDQRGVLKGARKKLLDIAGTLGLSNTTMRMIEKRAAQDKVLLIAGMVITLLIVVLTVKFIL